MFNDIRKTNVGVCKNTGKTFGELMQNILMGLDKSCIMADAGGNIRIIGDTDKNHEKILADR